MQTGQVEKYYSLFRTQKMMRGDFDKVENHYINISSKTYSTNVQLFHGLRLLQQQRNQFSQFLGGRLALSVKSLPHNCRSSIPLAGCSLEKGT